jgi:hypothetical protein
MKGIVVVSVLAMIGLPLAAQADSGGGSRQPAGGGFMSSYQDDPYHDPRSLHSQRAGTGQILGAPMLSENAGAKGGPVRSAIRRGDVDPSWATTGSVTKKRRTHR